jgi:hypothetical protein
MAFTAGNLQISSLSSRAVTLAASNTLTSTTTMTGTITGLDSFSIADLQLKVTAASGTTPTLDVYVQKLLPDGSTWDDVGHFTQMTSTGSNIMTLVAGNAGVHAQAVRNVSSGSLRTTHFGNTWRLDAVVGGTNPSFTFAIFGDFYS